jgi:single-strand DNA-binding protein
MSRGLNKAMIIGNLGGDPEMRYTPSGKPLTKFQLASNRNWTSAEGERKTETEWFTIIAWGKLAEICNQYLTKGQQVYIEGRIHTRKWKDEGGNSHSSVEITAQEMVMLGGRNDDSGPEDASDVDPEEDFPF